MPRWNCGWSEPEMGKGWRIWIWIWIQNKPQSIDRTKLPGPSVGSEPGDALIGHRVNSVVLLQGYGGLGRKKQPRNHKWCAQGEVSWARYILDGSKTVWRHAETGRWNHQPLEESRILMKSQNIPMSCEPRGRMNREKPKLGHLREWKKLRSGDNVKR